MKCDGHDKWRCCPLSRLISSMSRLVLMNITISLLIISISAHAQLVIPEDVEIAKPKPAEIPKTHESTRPSQTKVVPEAALNNAPMQKESNRRQPDIHLLDIQKVRGELRARIRTYKTTCWYRENAQFDDYELRSINLDDNTVEIYSVREARSFILKKKESDVSLETVPRNHEKDIEHKMITVKATRQQVGNKIKVITPICPEGVFCGIGETVEGMIMKSFDKDSVVFSMQQEIGRKEITITIPRE